MPSTHKNGAGNFFDRHLGTVVMVSVLFFGQIASYAVLQSRVNTLEEMTKDTVKQSEHKDLLRRTEMLEKEVVPRSEHLLRDAELNKRLDQIQESIREVQDRLDNRARLGKQ
jgi:hypothetical protein